MEDVQAYGGHMKTDPPGARESWMEGYRYALSNLDDPGVLMDAQKWSLARALKGRQTDDRHDPVVIQREDDINPYTGPRGPEDGSWPACTHASTFYTCSLPAHSENTPHVMVRD